MADTEELRQQLAGINRDKLDLESEDISATILDYGERVAVAYEAYSTAKNAVEVIKAKMTLRMVKFPGNYDLPAKPTKILFEAAVILQPKVQAAISEMHKTKRLLDSMKAAVYALVSKKKQIENLKQMNAVGFRTERQSNGVAEHIQQRNEVRQRLVRKGMKKGGQQ